MKTRKFLAELKRRNVYRAAVGYAAVAWLLIQVATQTLPFFEAPTWMVRVIIVVLLAGFPFAMAWAWMFELTGAGVVRSEEMPEETEASRWTGRKIDFVIIAVLVLAVGALLFDRMRPNVSADKSIAVLPFEDMSAEKGNAFFADGIQDDILTSLARISRLKVISRTSVRSYRGAERRNLREIGRNLGARTILEGSVRRIADRVVVNVQL
ncbi:MAG: hypothetical protein H0X73_12590, partial [Chthoniobacterales bacterium]|nr:hypothetical protein [Chthoniobacterales bacterium]